ncbi:MAG TPA: hypothetical protein VMF32_00580 [Xanthobacteraceae bacterium]|nr:hypothetical protein [Xanthobacteraceae bacterium]
MSVGTLAAPGLAKTSAFPKAAIEACLRVELIEAVKAEAGVKGITLPGALADIIKTPFQVDSLVVVSILCAVEPIIGFELPDSVVRTGGYASIEIALAHLLPRIESLWIKKKGDNS